MARPRWVLAMAAVLASGCANVVGLSELEEVDCVGAACKPGADASLDTATSVDTGAADSASVDSGVDTTPPDAEPDSGADDTAIDAPRDTLVVDVAPDTPVADTKPDAVVGDACTVSCDTVNSVGATCLGSLCAYSGCKAGFANCDTTAPDVDGCETQTTNTLNCGGCGNKCEPTNASTASCTSGACAYTCKSGFGDCDKSGGNTNGCETALNTILNCGGCGTKCDTVHSTGAACSGTSCTYSGCGTGYANCVTAAPDSDGCETPVATSKDNCGACGRACSTTNVASATCSGGVCTSTCNTGFSNCSKPATGPDDGCECATPGCCATTGGCAVTHKNGTSAPLGQSYWLAADYCKALGTPGDATTYTADMANAAAAAWGIPGTPIDAACAGGRIICLGNSTNGYASWGYTGSVAGHYYYQASGCGGPTKCCCPLATDPIWN